MKLLLSVLATVLFSLNSSVAQWTKINSIPNQHIVSLASLGSTLLAASDSDFIYESTDGGITWSQNVVSANLVRIITMKVIDNTVYVCTSNHGIFSSNDSGITWVNSGSNLLPVDGIAKHNGDLFASTLGNGIYRYNAASGNWLTFNDSLPTYSVNVNVVLGTPNSLLIAAGANGTFYRYNFNVNAWHEEYYYGILKPGLLIQNMLNNSDTIFAVNGNRIIRSEDDGISWTDDKSGSHNGTYRAIYSGASNHYTLTNLLNGGTWIQLRNKLASAGTSWSSNQELIPTGFSYDIIEFQNKLFLGKADGLYVKALTTGMGDISISAHETKIVSGFSGDHSINITGNIRIEELEIINLSGQIVYSKKVGEKVFSIYPGLNPGMYFISLTLQDGHHDLRKIIF